MDIPCHLALKMRSAVNDDERKAEGDTQIDLLTGSCGGARLTFVGVASFRCVSVLRQSHFPILVKLLIKTQL